MLGVACLRSGTRALSPERFLTLLTLPTGLQAAFMCLTFALRCRLSFHFFALTLLLTLAFLGALFEASHQFSSTPLAGIQWFVEGILVNGGIDCQIQNGSDRRCCISESRATPGRSRWNFSLG